MDRDWTASRIVTVLLLGGIVFLLWNILCSLDHQQEHLIRLTAEVRELRGVGLRAGPEAPAAATPLADDGKDEIGRPRAATPGFTMYPPIGKDIPGRTSPRNPASIPELCGTYIVSYPSEPDRFNYYLTEDGVTNRIDIDVHERLFTINPDNPQELWPELAVAWESAADHLTFRFHLRKGVEFSDGSPFDADDVLFTYNTIMDPGVESEYLRVAFDRIESVRKLDAYTVEVRMREPYWKALLHFGYTLRSLSKDYFEREIPRRAAASGMARHSTRPGEPGFAEVFNTFTREISPGTGPYQWKEGESWVPNQQMTLHSSVGAWKRKLNPDYYRVARLKYRFIKDDPTRHAEFRRGKLDTLVVDHGAWEDQLKNDPTITEIANHYTYDHIGLLHSTLYFNCRRFPFDDVRLRLAIAHLVDRQRILREVERGQGTVGTCPTKPIYPEYSPEIPVRNLDVELTRKLLREAGWTDTDGDGLLDKEGRVLEFSFAVPAARTFFRTLTALLQESCQGVGIRVKSDIKDWQRFKDDLNKLNFQLLCLYDSASDPWIDPYETFHSSQAGERGQNRSGWSNPQADKLLEEMRREFDPAKRAELFHRLNRLFDEDLPMLLLIHGKVGVLQNKRIRGTKVRATGLQHFDAWIHPEDAKKEEGPK